MTTAQIAETVSKREPSDYKKEKIRKYLRELTLARLIYKVKFVAGKGRGHARKVSSFDIFGNLTNKTYYCRFDCPNEVADFILENIPCEKMDDPNIRLSLVRCLKDALPRDTFLLVRRRLWTVI